MYGPKIRLINEVLEKSIALIESIRRIKTRLRR